MLCCGLITFVCHTKICIYIDLGYKWYLSYQYPLEIDDSLILRLIWVSLIYSGQEKNIMDGARSKLTPNSNAKTFVWETAQPSWGFCKKEEIIICEVVYCLQRYTNIIFFYHSTKLNRRFPVELRM